MHRTSCLWKLMQLASTQISQGFMLTLGNDNDNDNDNFSLPVQYNYKILTNTSTGTSCLHCRLLSLSKLSSTWHTSPGVIIMSALNQDRWHLITETGAADHYSEVRYSFFTRLIRQLSVVPKLHSLCTRWDHHQCAGMNCSAHIWRANKCMEADWHTERHFSFFPRQSSASPTFISLATTAKAWEP